MPKISSFDALLTCLNGHTTSGSRNGTSTRLLGNEPLERFPQIVKVGCSYSGLDVSHFDNAYSRLRWPARGEPIRVIEAWWCPTCEAEGLDSRHWALVVFEGERFVSMETIELAIKYLRTIHFLSGDLVDLFEWKLGSESLEALRGEWGDFDERLIEHLAPHLPA